MNAAKKRVCMYCGEPTGGVGKGEHLFPEAIGGTIRTKDVCSRCNNVLSDIDRELCSRSPVSIVAAREIDGYIAQAWDVDESQGNLLLEGRPEFNRSSFRIYPQIIITPMGEQVWANYDDLLEFGIGKFSVLFLRRLRKAFWEYEHGDRGAFWFEQIPPSADLVSRYRYWPRFFVRGSIAEACEDKTIVLSYLGRSSMRVALAWIESGMNRNPLDRFGVVLGSRTPTIRCFCDAGKVWRALAKIAVNLLHHYCERTRVDCVTFSRVIAEIMGTRPFPPSRVQRSGFVCASDVATMKSDTKSHTFRLSWGEERWTAVFAFFGGQIGAVVEFPGPNKEQWCRLDVRAPVSSQDWDIVRSRLIIPTRFRIEWSDMNRLIADTRDVRLPSQ